MSPAPTGLLKIEHLTHIFRENGITPCSDISLEINRGEILAIMGENGAGKSTLMFLISGFMKESSGRIITPEGDSREARRLLSGMVHQKPILAGNLTVLENMILSPEKGFFRKETLKQEIQAVQKHYDLPLDLDSRARSLTAPQIQRCELIRALWKKKELLILDEPTASLSPTQSEELFELIFRLKAEGKTILFITHKIHEVMKIADRIAVLRQGKLQGTACREEMSPAEISRLMIGEDEGPEYLENSNVSSAPDSGEMPVLELTDIQLSELGSPRLKKISFQLFPGEILGIGGIRENGLIYIEDLLSGIIQPDSGFIFINGENRMPLTPLKMRRSGISYIPADRLSRGADPESTLAENISVLKRQRGRGSYRARLIQRARIFIKEHGIRGDAEQQVKTLSGGNIQKMIVARELENRPPLLIVSEPSWGLDFKSRKRLHRQLIQAARDGIAVLLLTTDLDELLSISSRVCVLTEGVLSIIERNEEQWNRNYIGEKMTGADRV
ncbi:MAG: ATP-binding cassette domain-containing protein [Spirochaetales bacterium]|nr:ATP-binding cassette domain-containing protein [Spirochaetales bacterium]